jgi:hypothetical protein
MTEPRYIRFELEGKSDSGKTQIWKVFTKDSNVLLGYVKWYSPWHRYSFIIPFSHVQFDLVFEWTCLRDIANFCENQTQQQRKEACH